MGGKVQSGRSDADRFRKLILLIGLEDSADDAARGGSFGFGKTAYIGASTVRTVAYYSVFEPSEDTEGVSARLFVASYFDTHEFQGESFTGRAWYGVPDDQGSVWPLVDDDAHELAELLGFDGRSAEETGASLMIIDSHLDLSKIRQGIEDYWWPRLLDTNLSVVLQDGSDEMAAPNPKSRADLAPFIRGYVLASNTEEHPTDGSEIVRSLSPIDDKQLGRWAAVELPKPDPALQEALDLSEDEHDPSRIRPDTVALMRSPRMIVEYLEVGGIPEVSVAGVFLADPDIEAALRMSEPAPHDAWIPTNLRLAEVPGGAELVKRTLTRLITGVRGFKKSLVPPPPVIGGDLTAVEKILGQMLGSPNPHRPSGPRREHDPLEFDFVQAREPTANGDVITGQVRLGTKTGSPDSHLIAEIKVGVEVLSTDVRSWQGNEVMLASLTLDGRSMTDPNAPFIVTLKQDRPTLLDVVSDAFDADWEARIFADVSARIRESE